MRSTADKEDQKSSAILIEVMEPRVLLSADALGLDSGQLDSYDDTLDGHTVRESGYGWIRETTEDNLIASQVAETPIDVQPLQQEIIFLDAGVDDGGALLTELLESERDASVQVYLIDTVNDGVDQITEILKHHRHVDAVHVISHGAAGQLQLGASTLSLETLGGYAGQLGDWGEALSGDADILFYGCDFIGNDADRSLINAISQLTGADVAASQDKTGNADIGGDWDLEIAVGEVETTSLAAGGAPTWQGQLATIIVDTFDDIEDGGDTSSIDALKANPGNDGISLAEAVIASNADAGADVIQLAVGTYTMSVAGAGEDHGSEGDLDIRDSLTIIGAGAHLTTIDGGGLDRVMHIIPDSDLSVTISHLKIQNGVVSDDGGGIYIGDSPNTASVVLDSVWIAGNHANGLGSYGGAIYNLGELTISDSLIEGSTANSGGAITNDGGGKLKLTNVTMSGNSATLGYGGALYNTSVATLVNVTASENTAIVGGGGIRTTMLSASASTTIVNTLVADNESPNDPDVSGAFVSALGDNLIKTPGGATGLHAGDITGVDPNVSALQDNGGSTPSYALLEGSPAIDAGSQSGAPTADQRGVARDDNLPDIGAYEVPTESTFTSLLFTTANDVSSSGVPGLDSWNVSALLDFDLGLASTSTLGTITRNIDFNSMGLSDVGISAMHFVGRDITVGDSDSFDLLRGDLILSVDNNGQTLNSNNSINVDEDDVFVFRPDTSGDYSQGTFTLLLDRDAMPGHIDAITLVEKRTLVGDKILQAGDFLLAASGGDDNSIIHYAVSGVGSGSTAGTETILVAGDDISMGERVSGLDLLENSTTIAGTSLDAGQILISSRANQLTVGSAPSISAAAQDIYVLDVSTTGEGTTAATASLLLEGGTYNLDDADEKYISFTLVSSGPDNEQAIAVNTGASVAEGSTGTVLTSAMLETTDAENTAAQLVYTMTTEPAHGALLKDGTVLGLNDTFTQEDLNLNQISYDHDGSESASDYFGFSVDDGQGESSSDVFSISITAVNDEESITTNTGASVVEGAIDFTLSSAMLETSDPDNTPDQIVYTMLSTPASGILYLDSSALVLNSTFTQADINNNRISYDHDGSESTSDSFDFSVDDGAGITSADTLSISITALNDEQSIATNTGVTVDEGDENTVISAAMLETVDPDNTALEIVYSVTSVPENGLLKLNDVELNPGDIFTQDDIDNNRVSYDHDGSETSADSLDFIVDDSQGTNTSGTFNISVNPVNDEQSLVVNTGLTVDEGSLGSTVSTAILQTADPDNSAAELVYTLVSLPAHGAVNLDGNALALDGSFTQSDIDSNRVSYDHDGSESSGDRIELRVDDGAGASSVATFTIAVTAVNDEQSLLNNAGIVVDEGDLNTVVPSTVLQTTDPDNQDDEIVYRVTAVPLHGELKLNGVSLSIDGTFTQNDIDSNRLSYDHDSSDTVVDGFSFAVDDGQGVVHTGTFNIAINPVNDEETLIANVGMSVDEGSTGSTISSAMLNTTDSESSAAQLIYSVSAPPIHGQLSFDGMTLAQSDTFTQADIDNNRIRYDHDGSETTADTIDFVVDDGEGAETSGTFNISLNPVNDEQSLAVNAGLTVDEGSTGTTISPAMLMTADVDNTASELIYSVLAPPQRGVLTLDGTTSITDGQFTQQDVDAGRLAYDHDGSEELTDGFEFRVDDGEGVASAGSFSIAVSSINDEQSVDVNRGMTVHEGETDARLTSAMLLTTDVDNTAEQIAYTVITAPMHGRLYLNDVELTVADRFTQSDINEMRVSYEHDGSETDSDSFGFVVDDESGLDSQGSFAISVTPINDEQQVIINAGLSVVEGSQGNTISSDIVNTVDNDNSPAELVYTLTAPPSNGLLKINDIPLGERGTFTQQAIENGIVSYDHDGSETLSDSVQLSVDDGVGEISVLTLDIDVQPTNDTPQFGNPMPDQIASEDESFRYDIAPGAFTDSDSGDALTFIATQTDGSVMPDWLVFNSTDLSFSGTPAQSDTGTVSIRLTAVDGSKASISAEFDLTVVAVNDPPEILVSQLSVVAGDTLTLSTHMLAVTDVDTDAENLVFSVLEIEGGQFELTSDPGTPVDHFTQAQLASGEVLFVDDGDDFTPSFQLVIDDGQVSEGPFAVRVNFTPVPDATTDSFIEFLTAGDTSNSRELAKSQPDKTEDKAEKSDTTTQSSAPEANFPDELNLVSFDQMFDEQIVANTVPSSSANGIKLASTSVAGNDSIQSALTHLLAKNSTALDVLLTPFEPETVSSEINSMLTSAEFQTELNKMHGDINSASMVQQAVIGSSVAVTSGLSVGYVIWVIRGGVLLSTVLSSMPAWQFVDPLPVLGNGGVGRESNSEESLQDIIDKNAVKTTDQRAYSGGTLQPGSGSSS